MVGPRNALSLNAGHARRDQPPSETKRTAGYKIRNKLKRKTMNLFKATTTMCCIAAMSAVLAPGARADDNNRKTTITFSGPVEIPGVTGRCQR